MPGRASNWTAKSRSFSTSCSFAAYQPYDRSCILLDSLTPKSTRPLHWNTYHIYITFKVLKNYFKTHGCAPQLPVQPIAKSNFSAWRIYVVKKLRRSHLFLLSSYIYFLAQIFKDYLIIEVNDLNLVFWRLVCEHTCYETLCKNWIEVFIEYRLIDKIMVG